MGGRWVRVITRIKANLGLTELANWNWTELGKKLGALGACSLNTQGFPRNKNPSRRCLIHVSLAVLQTPIVTLRPPKEMYFFLGHPIWYRICYLTWYQILKIRYDIGNCIRYTIRIRGSIIYHTKDFLFSRAFQISIPPPPIISQDVCISHIQSWLVQLRARINLSSFI